MLQQEAQTPEELVGARVSVLWQEDGVPLSKKGPKDEDWYSGQLVGYDGEKGTHTIFYDDGSQEEVDLGKEKFRLVYQLKPPALAAARAPPR